MDGYDARTRAGRSDESPVDELSDDLHARAQVLTRGLRLSILVSLVALAFTVLAYAIDQIR